MAFPNIGFTEPVLKFTREFNLNLNVRVTGNTKLTQKMADASY